jgi:hypothetical protein
MLNDVFSTSSHDDIVEFDPMAGPYLLVIVDAEEEFDWTQFSSSSVSVKTIRKQSALPRHQPRVTFLLPRSNQTLELANTDPESFRPLALAKTMLQGLTHNMHALPLRSTHQKIPVGHMPLIRARCREGTF